MHTSIRPRTQHAPVLLVLALASPLIAPAAARAQAADALELSAGVSSLMLLSTFTGNVQHALELTAHGRATRSWWWAAGTRLGFAPMQPEVFVRIDARPEFVSWAPAAGLELGVTARAGKRSGDPLLAELREHSRDARSAFYLAFVAAPLCFRIFDRCRVALRWEAGSAAQRLRPNAAFAAESVPPPHVRCGAHARPGLA